MDTTYVSKSYQAAKTTCTKKVKSHQDVVSYYKQYHGVSSIENIKKKIFEELKGSINLKDEAIGDCNKGLVESIHDAVFSGDQDFPREYHLIYRLRDMIREITSQSEENNELVEKEDWILAIQLAEDFDALKGPLPIIDKKNRDWDTSSAILSLTKQGVEFELKDGDYYIHENGKESAQKILQDLMDEIGGETIINYVIKHELKDYSEEAKRFIHLPESAKCAVVINRHALPSNMILNLALKKITSTQRNLGEIGKALDHDHFIKVKKKALEIARGFNYEPYTHMEYLNIPANKLAKALLELSLYASIYQFVQMDPRLANKILQKLSDNYGQVTIEGITIKEICLFSKHIISIAPENAPSFKREKDFKKIPILSKNKNIKKLIELTSISKEEINSSYTIPGERSDYFFYPLICTLNKKICLLPKSLIANAAVERVFSLIRKTSASSDFENKFGKDQLEEILREIHYDTHKIDVYQGNILGTVYETDGIIVTENHIHIFESKMKSLIQASRAGDDVSLIRDMVKSLLYSQSQMMDIEYELRSKGHIEINDKNGVHKIKLLDRRVKRHSLVLHDYGVLQHKQIVFHFLSSLLQYGFNHPDRDRNKILTNLESDIERFRNSFRKLYDMGALPKNNPLHDSSFLNYSDIFCVLNMAVNEHQYFMLLNSIDTVVFGMAPPVYSAIGRLQLENSVNQ